MNLIDSRVDAKRPGDAGTSLAMTQEVEAPMRDKRNASSGMPKWKRGDLADRIRNHLFAEAIYERQVGDTLQVIERVRLRGFETNAYARSSYRLVEVRDGKARIVFLDDTLRDTRRRADRRAS